MKVRHTSSVLWLVLSFFWASLSDAETCNPQLVLQGDFATTSAGTAVWVDLLANDSSGCGAPMTVTLQADTCPGVALDNGDGTLTYQPTPTEAGQCQLLYDVLDEDGGFGTATVMIQVDAGPPDPTPLGLPTLDPRDPHRFFAGGEAVHLAGYYPGIQALLVADPNAGLRGQHVSFLNALASHHINLLRTVLTMGMAMEEHDWLHPYGRSGTCCTYHSGEEPGVLGNKFNLSVWNESFFQYWVDVAAAARDRGIVLQVALLDGFHSKVPDDPSHDDDPEWVPLDRWGFHYSYFSSKNSLGIGDVTATSQLYQRTEVVNAQIAFVERAVSDLCHFDNIIWETINEPHDGFANAPLADFGGRSWQEVMRDTIRSTEASAGCSNHLIMPFDSPDHRNLAGHFTPSGGGGADDGDAEYLSVYGGLVKDFEQDFPNRPLIADNDCCVTPGTPAQLRKKAWLSLVAGANPSMLVYDVHRQGIGAAVTQDGMRFVGYTKALIDEFSVDLVGMVPRDDLIAQTPSDFVWLLAREGEEYIAYLYGGGSVTFNGGALPSTFEAFWFDPVTGISQAATPAGSTFVTSGALADEAVLYLRSTQPPGPVITIDLEPQPVTVPVGGTAEFVVGASSAPPTALTFEWLRNNAPLPTDGRHVVTTLGSTSTLTVSPLAFIDDQADFRCVVSAAGASSVTSAAPLLSVVEGSSSTVVDGFELNGLDRTLGAPLHGTGTEAGDRLWSATPEAIFGGSTGSGFVTHPQVTVPVGEGFQIIGGVSYDASQQGATPILTLSGDVQIVGEGWIALGFSDSATGSYFTPSGHGQIWMLLREDGRFDVHGEGSGVHAPMISGTAGDFTPGGFNTLVLEYDSAASTVSAWVNSEQVLWRSWLPPDSSGGGSFADRIDITHAGFQMNLKNGGAAGRMKVDDFRVEAGTVATRTRAPYLGAPHPLPGTLEAEAFDLGGEGVSYSDAEARNSGGYRRPGSGYEGTDMVLWPGASSAFVGAPEAGEMLEYSVSVATAGDYELNIKTGTDSNGGQIHFELDGAQGGSQALGPAITIPNTGGSFKWLPSPPVVSLAAGQHILRFVVDAIGASGFRFDLLQLTAFAPPVGAPLAVSDWVVLPYDSTQSSFTIPGAALLANDSPAGVEIVDTVCCKADLLTGGEIEFTPDGYFWSHRDDAFEYVIAHPDDEEGRTDQALVRVIAGGPVADDEIKVTLCSPPGAGGTAGALTFPLSDLLDTDLPAARIQWDGIAVQAAHGQVSVDLGSGMLTYTPDNVGPDAFCANAPDQFSYRIRLQEAPAYMAPGTTSTATGTVTVLGSNPVEANDDAIDFPVDRGNLPLSLDDILGNDEPAGAIGLDGLAFSSAFFTLWDVPGGFNLVLDDPAGFHSAGSDSLLYRVCLLSDPGVCDTALLHIRAIAVAGADEFLLPLSPASGGVVLTSADLLANDSPPGHLQLLGASNGVHGLARRVGDTVVYTPDDSFWEAGADTFAYQVSYDADPTAPAEATVFIVAESGFGAVDDAFGNIPTTQDPTCVVPALEFFAEDVLANDRPYDGELSIVGFQTTTTAGGTISAPGGPGFHYCPPEGWPTQGVDSAHYTMRLQIGDVTHSAVGRIYFYPAAVPALAAVADAFLAPSDVGTEMAFDDLLGNDQGQGLTVEAFPSPPAHGTLDIGADSVTYLPEPDFVGEDSFTYTVRDADGRESDRGRISVTVELVARPDHFLVPEGVAGLALPKVALLANDAPSQLQIAGNGGAAFGTVIDFGDSLVYQPGADFWRTGSDAFTYTVGTGTGLESSTSTVHLSRFGPCSSLQEDDFEGGDLSLWDGVQVVGQGDVRVDPAAALEGLLGLAVELPVQVGAPQVRLIDNLPEAQRHYRISFLLDPSGLRLPSGAAFSLLDGRSGATKPFAVQLVGGAKESSLRLRVLDGGVTFPGPQTTLRSATAQIHMEWWASSAPGRPDGGARLWIDRHLVSELLGLDTGDVAVTTVRLGAVSAVDAGTVGVLYFDEVSACSGERDRVPLHKDGFESGDASAWGSVVANGGGTLEVIPAAGLEGSYALRVGLEGAQNLWVEDRSPQRENHYWARFLIDTGSLRSHNQHPIFTGFGPAGNVFSLEISQMPDASQYFLHLKARKNVGGNATASAAVLPNGVHEVLLEWRAATDPTAADGLARLWVAGAEVAEVLGLANSERLLDGVRLGAIHSLDAAISGSYFFDAFESWRGWNSRRYRQRDDFESGDLSAWSEAGVSGAGSVAATPVAALDDAFGLEVNVLSGDAAARVGTSWTDLDRTQHLEFLFDPNSLAIPNGDFTVLQGWGAGGTAFSLRMRSGVGGYELWLLVRRDAGNYLFSSWQPFADAPQSLTLEWRAATAPGLADGLARVWLGSTLIHDLSGIDNSVHTLEGLRLGAVFGLDPGTVGNFYFDNFRTWK